MYMKIVQEILVQRYGEGQNNPFGFNVNYNSSLFRG